MRRRRAIAAVLAATTLVLVLGLLRGAAFTITIGNGSGGSDSGGTRRAAAPAVGGPTHIATLAEVNRTASGSAAVLRGQSWWSLRRFGVPGFDPADRNSDAAAEGQPGSPSTLPAVRSIMNELNAAPQCRVLGPTFVDYVAKYLFSVHAALRRELQQAERGAASSAGAEAGWLRQWGRRRRLVYSCESHVPGRFCGGAGDRFRGIISAFFLALLTRRKFELYHPVPVALQELLHPRLLHWLPTVAGEGGAVNDDASAEQVTAEMGRFDPDLQMMRLKGHKRFLARLWAEESSSTSNRDATIRMQTNSFGVDGFLHRVDGLLQRKTQDMGLPAHCNITCYFGCLHYVLFRRSRTLGEVMREVLAPLQRGAAAGELHLSPLDHSDSPLMAGGAAEASEALPVALTGGEHGDRRPQGALFGALLSVQVRIGGSWAPGLRIPEPFRTHPAAVAHFFSLIDELRTGRVAGLEYLRDCTIFVSSDSERFINETVARFGVNRVLFVQGDAFGHTDTLNLGNLKPEKYQILSPASVRGNYVRTLANHMLIGEGDHIVMAQSGFGDTGFWRGRRSASCIFVDMNNNRLAWQHHLTYEPRIRHALANDGAAAREARGKLLEKIGLSGPSSAFAIRNRIINIHDKPSNFFPPA